MVLLLQYYCQQDTLLILLHYLQHQLHTEVGTAMAQDRRMMNGFVLAKCNNASAAVSLNLYHLFSVKDNKLFTDKLKADLQFVMLKLLKYQVEVTPDLQVYLMPLLLLGSQCFLPLG